MNYLSSAFSLLETMKTIVDKFEKRDYKVSTINDGPFTIWVERKKVHFSMTLMTVDYEPVIKVVIAMENRDMTYFDSSTDDMDMLDWIGAHIK